MSIYVREAHPSDEWQMRSNEKDGLCYPQPRNLAQRRAIACDFAERFAWPLPMVVDAMENPADILYGGWPERIYILDRHGIIIYKGHLGPSGFDPEEAAAVLASLD